MAVKRAIDYMANEASKNQQKQMSPQILRRFNGHGSSFHIRDY